VNSKTQLTDIIKFYRDQLKKFYKLGIGNKTEHRVVVTDGLIDITKKRLYELQTSKANFIYRGSQNGIK